MVISAFDSPAVADAGRTSTSTAAAGAAAVHAASSAATPTSTASPSPASSAASSSAASSSSAPASSSAASFDAASVAEDVAAVISAFDVDASDVSIAAYGEDSGSTYSYGSAADFDTASIVKVDILAALLLQHQDNGTSLTDDELSLATSMIENSDNDAASALWDDIGDDQGLTAANARLGLTQTVAGTDGYWGLSETSAADQLVLLHDVVDDDSVLDAGSRQLILSLMSQVDDDQSWGVSAAADTGTTTALKNGWLQDDDGSWIINSIGRVTVDGHTVLLAIVTRGQDSESDGIQLVQRLAEAVAAPVAG